MTGKRERILEGMLEAVGDRGYEQTTVQDAIKAAGLYRQAFYDSFSGKEDCYLQALTAGLAWVESVMRASAAAESTWRGQLRSSLRGLLRFLDEPSLRSDGRSWSRFTPPGRRRSRSGPRRWRARRR